MTKRASALLLFTFLFAGAVATSPARAGSINVIAHPGVIALPDTETYAQSMYVSLEPSAMRVLFDNVGVTAVAKTFPDFAPEDTLATAPTGETVRLFDLSEVYTIYVPEGTDEQAFADSLAAYDGVVAAEINHGITNCDVIPNDPLFGQQWGLHSASGEDVHAPQAWQRTTGTTVAVGIVDNGVWGQHPDLLGKVSGDAGYDAGGHGTHVAGIAAASTNNAVGVAGVDWAAPIVAEQYGSSDQNIYDAVMRAVNAGAMAINSSFVLTKNGTASRYSAVVNAAYSNAYKLNRVCPAAVGNYSTSAIYYPAGFAQDMVAVAATDQTRTPASFTNYGPHVDLAAPGVSILSTVPYGSGYDYFSGTSMSTPFVTGAAALLYGYQPPLYALTWYNDDVKQVLRLSTDDVVNAPASPGRDDYSGTGRLNIDAALALVTNPNHLYQASVTGGTDVGSTNVSVTFYSTPGLATGTYYTHRHEIRTNVTFPRAFSAVIGAWGRGVASTGYSAANPNFASGYCDLVPGTLTNTGCQLRSYIYDVYDVLGRHVGWVPTSNPGAVRFAYSVVGRLPVPTAAISGPALLNFGQGGTWTVTPGGGDGNYTYQWRTRTTGTQTWSAVVGTAATFSKTMDVAAGFELQATVLSNGEQAVSTYGVQCNLCDPPPAQVTNLAVVGTQRNGAQLSWTAPGEDGSSGTASQYDLRFFAGGPLNEGNFYLGHRILTMPPQEAGSPEYACTDSLNANTYYWFMLKTQDNNGHWSSISNEPYTHTPGMGPYIICDLGMSLKPAQEEPTLPTLLSFGLPRPNPARDQVSFEVEIPQRIQGQSARLLVFDVSGRVVRELLNGPMSAGRFTLGWDLRGESGTPVRAGLYFTRFTVGSEPAVVHSVLVTR